MATEDCLSCENYSTKDTCGSCCIATDNGNQISSPTNWKPKKGKPRICEILNVEINQIFKLKNAIRGFYVDKDGIIKREEDNESIGLPVICAMINNPDLIERNPYFNKEDIEKLKAIKVIYPNAYYFCSTENFLSIYNKDKNTITTLSRNNPITLKTDLSCIYNIDEIIEQGKEVKL